jgi:hypothetical protein
MDCFADFYIPDSCPTSWAPGNCKPSSPSKVSASDGALSLRYMSRVDLYSTSHGAPYLVHGSHNLIKTLAAGEMTTSKHLARYVQLDKTLKCLRNLWSKMYLKKVLHVDRNGMGGNKFPKQRVIMNRQRKVRSRNRIL